MSIPVIRLVDDEAELRRAQAFVLELAGFETRQYASAEEFLERDDHARPGCVVMDVRMEGMSGLQCQQAMNERGIRLPVLFLTGHGDAHMAVVALKRGAADFLQKPVPAEELVAACRALVEWDARRRETEAGRERAKALIAALSAREKEVASLVGTGLPNKAIAERLGVSEQNIKIHRSNIYAKLGVHSAVEIRSLLEAAAQGAAGDELLTLRVLPEGLGGEDRDKPEKDRN